MPDPAIPPKPRESSFTGQASQGRADQTAAYGRAYALISVMCGYDESPPTLMSPRIRPSPCLCYIRAVSDEGVWSLQGGESGVLCVERACNVEVRKRPSGLRRGRGRKEKKNKRKKPPIHYCKAQGAGDTTFHSTAKDSISRLPAIRTPHFTSFSSYSSPSSFPDLYYIRDEIALRLERMGI